MTRIQAYVVSVGVGALAAAAAVAAMSPAFDVAWIRGALWLSGLGLIANLLIYSLPVGAAGSIGFIPTLATALIAPNWLAVVAVASSTALTEAIRRPRPLKGFFNVAQISLAVSLAIIAYLVLGGRSLFVTLRASAGDYPGVGVIPVAALVLVFFASNSLAVSAVIALTTERRLIEVWRQNTLSTASYDLISGVVVYLLAWLFVRFGPVGAAGLAVPLLIVRQLYTTNFQLERVNQELLELMVKAIEARDPYTSGHSRRVAHYSKLIARAIGLNAKQVERIGTAALLHDVGKIHEIYAPILRKPDKLTAEEWEIIKTHPIKSAELVGTVSHLKDLVAPVRHHHENWDGSGYPDGLAGERIPLAARIILFADTIDAMTSDRPYRKALGEAQVRSELVKHRGRQFDPEICDKLLASPMFGLLFVQQERVVTPRQEESVQARRLVRLIASA